MSLAARNALFTTAFGTTPCPQSSSTPLSTSANDKMPLPFGSQRRHNSCRNAFDSLSRPTGKSLLSCFQSTLECALGPLLLPTMGTLVDALLEAAAEATEDAS